MKLVILSLALLIIPMGHATADFECTSWTDSLGVTHTECREVRGPLDELQDDLDRMNRDDGGAAWERWQQFIAPSPYPYEPCGALRRQQGLC